MSSMETLTLKHVERGTNASNDIPVGREAVSDMCVQRLVYVQRYVTKQRVAAEWPPKK